MKNLDITQLNKESQLKNPRVSIADISQSGKELNDEQLNLVVGGLRSIAASRPCEPDMCTPNCDVGYC